MIRFACARLWQPTAQRAALHLIWYSVVVIIAAASQALPAQAQCLDQMRKLQLTDGAIRLKSYVCEVGGKSRKVRVELQRLSEVAAGSLVQNTPHPDVERALGRVRVVSNEILTEARELFTRFATKRVVQSCHSLELTAPGGASYSSRSDQSCNKRRTMWYFSFPDQENATTIDISLPEDLAYIQNQTRWPSGYKFWYSDCIGTAFIECTTIWRPASENMISDYNSNKERLEKKLGINSSRSLDPDDYSTRVEKYFSLVKHLMHEVWRDDFMHVTGTFDECGGIDFSLHLRQLILDVVTVENVSAENMSVSDLLGARSDGGLRKASTSNAPDGQRIPLGGGHSLRPGEKIAIPLRISFAPSVSLSDAFPDPENAERHYRTISSGPPGTMFRTTAPGAPTIRKVKESFGSPSSPKPSDLVFGTEFNVGGLIVDGSSIHFEKRARNFLQLTAGDGYGSCPFLYAWDPDAKTWVWRGKILHAANSLDKQREQVVSFDGLVSRFKLVEEEMEHTRIDRAMLRLEMQDGTVVTVRSRVGELIYDDHIFVAIHAGESLQLDFDIPDDVHVASVRQSHLLVSGFYSRYSAMTMQSE